MSRHEADALLSVAQAAMMLGVHPNTIRAWTEAGRLTAYRINSRGDRRFRRADVAQLLVEDGGRSDETQPAEGHHAAGAFGRIARALAQAPGPLDVARAAAEAVRLDLGAEMAAIYLGSADRLALAAHAGFRTPPPDAWPLDGEGLDGCAALPLTGRHGEVGVLVTDRNTAARMANPLGRALLESIATALLSARSLARARRELRRARALRSVTKELAGELDLERVVESIVDRTRTLFGADRAGLWMFEGTPHPVALVTRGLSPTFLARSAALTSTSETIALRALRETAPQCMRDAHLDRAVGEMREAYAQEGIRTVCIVPLLGQGGPIGVIGLYNDDDRSWPEEEVALVQAFADQAAVAIQNARLYRSIQDQAARMRSIHDLSARLNGLTDVRAIAEAIVAEARTLADYHDIRVYRVDHEHAMCEPIAFTRQMLEGTGDDAEELLRVEVGQGFTGWVAEHGEPLLINDALHDERGMTIVGTDDVPESMLLVPMLYEGRTLGVIVLSELGFNRFTDDDLQTMTIFAGYAAQAMANAASYERLLAQSSELSRRADSQRRLLAINERLLSTLDHASVLETIADGLHDVVAYDNLSIYRTDPVARLMHPVLTREDHAEEVGRYLIPYGRGLMGWAVEHREPILANDALGDPRALQIPGTPPDPEAVVVVPLIADGEVLGALNVSRMGGSEVHFSENDFELIQLFAAQASIALRNADTHHAVRLRAETDSLTGLGNHGAFQRDLGQLLDAVPARGRGAGRRVAVLMMDLDSFKAYNDNHGHPAGDALLHRAATAIYGAARSEDRVYRYGGDEFALILSDTGVRDAARVGERIRLEVASLTSDDVTPVTITVGVAGFPTDATDRAGLISAADSALYYGKRSGENRVVRADRLPPDVEGLRGTLEELAAAALRETDEEHAVEHIVERAVHLTAPQHDAADSLRDALLTISRSLHGGGADGGHADRVGRLAAAIAERLHLPEDACRVIELAARLHTLDDRGVAELSPIPSLRDVSTLVAAHRQLVADGRRRARRAARARGRIGAHVVAVANAYDELVAGGQQLGRREAVEALRSHAATFRADVVDALAAVVAQRSDPGRRRRSADAPGEEASGAA